MNYKQYLVLLCLWSGCEGVEDIDMIMSFIKLDDRPTTVLMPHACWSRYKLKTLSKDLCDSGISLAHTFQANRTEYFLQHVIVLADLSCPGSDRFLIKASEEELFKSPYRWLLITSDDVQWAVLKDLSILIDSDVVISTKVGHEQFLFIEGCGMSSRYFGASLPVNIVHVTAPKYRELIPQPYHVYKITETSEPIFTTRGSWQNNPKTTTTSATPTYSNDTVMSTEDPKQDNSKTSSSSVPLSFSNILAIKKKTKVSSIIEKINETNAEERKLVVNKYGQIEDYRRTKVLSSRRNNVRGHTLTMVNVITDSNETRNHMSDRLNLHQDSISKMSYSIVKICFEMLNATEKLMFTHTWGYKDKNGKWQGVVDYLMKKEGDLGTLTIFTQERMQVVDYIAMVGSTAVRFVFREPPLAYLSNIFALPFTGTVWLAIFICVLGCALFLYITSKWEASMSLHPLQLDGSWADVLILIIGAVLQQGCTLEPRYAAGRVVMLILFIAMTILYAAYSANIVVLLRAPSSSVRSLPDLLNSPLKLGASDFEYNRYFFKKLNEPVRKAIYDKKIAPKGKKPNFYTMEEGVEKIRQGLFAFHMELNPGYRLIQETYQEDEKCDLVEIDYINEIDPWVPGQKRAALKDLYKINFIKIRESGIQACNHHRLHVPKPKCSGAVSTFSSVGITDMYPAMLATLYGFLLAPSVLLVEIAYHKLLVARATRARIMDISGEDFSLQLYCN